MSTITNQTLTLTITSGTVETVIRKDNCRIDTFGDYVRLTDYTGERYEFLYSDVSSPSSTSATDLAETLEGYLNTGGGGGGVESGTWVPTISGETGISPVVIRDGWYTKIGNVINATCGFSIEFDVTEAEQGFEFTLPIEPNNDFDNFFQIQGVAYNGSSITDTEKIEVISNTGTKKGYFIVTLSATGSSCNCVISITYSIDN